MNEYADRIANEEAARVAMELGGSDQSRDGKGPSLEGLKEAAEMAIYVELGLSVLAKAKKNG